MTQGLVQLGFYLMDTFGPKPGPFGKSVEGSATVARTPTQQACKLGGQVLLQGFKVNHGFYFINFENNCIVSRKNVVLAHWIVCVSSMTDA